MIAQLVIPATHPAFAGHFPGRPIVPGVVLLDAAIQNAGLGARTDYSVSAAKFLRTVAPNEALELHTTATATGVRVEIVTAAVSGNAPEKVASIAFTWR